jgi:hypothetical protein
MEFEAKFQPHFGRDKFITREACTRSNKTPVKFKKIARTDWFRLIESANLIPY